MSDYLEQFANGPFILNQKVYRFYRGYLDEAMIITSDGSAPPLNMSMEAILDLAHQQMHGIPLDYKGVMIGWQRPW